MVLPNHTLGKPHKSQELEAGRNQKFSEEELEARHAVNGISAIRGKRAITHLKDICDPQNTKCPGPECTPSSGNACEIGRYSCLGYHEAVCKPWSFLTTCTRQVSQKGIPKCLPHYRSRDIIDPSGVRRAVLQTDYCSC